MNLKELAKLLELSQTTVSRALNGYPEVREATRVRVQAAARQHDYSPNTRAQGLATGRSRMIGHVIQVSGQHEMVNPIFGDFISGASSVYKQNGYDMMLSLVEDGDEERAYRSLASKGLVDGIIVHGPKMNDPRIEMLNAIGMPYVVHGRATGIDAPYSWVDVNNKMAFERATEFLLHLGHERIALINGQDHMDFADRRKLGYLAALATHDIRPQPTLLRSAEMTEVYGHHQAREMLRLDKPPTAILCSSMISALGVRRAIEELNLTMGKDVSVITFDDELSYLANGQDIPIFTAARSSVREAGKISAEMLIGLINHPDSGPVSRLLEADLVVGRSTGPARQLTSV